MKILYITPHLSTGGAPQYLFKKIEELHKEHEVFCIEYADLGGNEFVVQKNKIKSILNERLITLYENKSQLLDKLKEINPDIVHFEELPEYFCDPKIADAIYNPSRNYKIIETSHDSSFEISNKIYLPDKFIFVSDSQKKMFDSLNIDSVVIEYPIEYKTKVDREKSLKDLGLDPDKFHILNVGLFTPRKNQAEIIEYARKLLNKDVEFHFVGNQAMNFQHYWESLMENFPSNCKWWGEQSNVDKFYNAMDLFLFTSRGTDNDKETNPLVLREAISWNLPILMYDLEVYGKMHHKFKNIEFLKFDDLDYNLELISSKIKTKNKKELKFNDLFYVQFDPSSNKFTLDYLLKDSNEFKIVFKDYHSNVPIYWFNAVFENYTSWFAIPCPVHTINFIDNPAFGKFLIEVYTMDGEIVCSSEYHIKEIDEKYHRKPLNIKNPFDSIFNNYNEMFIQKKYDCYEIDDLDVVIDIGANSGLFSKLCLEKNANKVISIEPNPKCHINLNSILDECDNVNIISKAISTTNDPLTLYTLNEFSTVGSVDISNFDKNSNIIEYAVESITLNEIIKDHNLHKISLVKIDIEGYEYDIIESINESDFQKIDAFLIEFHNNDGVKLNKLLDKLHVNGFYISQIRDQNDKNNPKIDITQLDKHRNGTIYLRSNKFIENKSKMITLVDCFVSDSIINDKLNEFLNKFKDFDTFLITNTPVDKNILSKTKYTMYDSSNRLFSDNIKYDKSNRLFITHSINNFIVTDAMQETQRHGLSVIINLLNALKIAKLMGYTHFQRFEVDDLYGDASMNYIKTISQNIPKNKKGLFYANHEKSDISFHYFTCEIDYFIKLIPNIVTEEDYMNAIVNYDTFINVEKFMYQYVINSDIFIKPGSEMNVDFSDTQWNTHTSNIYYDDKYNGYHNKLYKKLIDGNETDEYIIFSVNRTDKQFTRYIKVIYNDGTETDICHISKFENEWCYSDIGSNVSKIKIYDENHVFLIGETIDSCFSTINFKNV